MVEGKKGLRGSVLWVSKPEKQGTFRSLGNNKNKVLRSPDISQNKNQFKKTKLVSVLICYDICFSMSVKLFKFMLILSLKTGRKEDIKWKFPQMVKCWQSVVSGQ